MTKITKKEHKSESKNKSKTLIRLFITLIAFLLLIKYGNVDLREAIKYLTKTNPGYILVAYIFYLITNLLAGFRFYTASSVLGFQKNFMQCIQLNFVGAFFNNFLPTTFGGDALRGYYLKRGTHVSISKAVGCLICERYAGMIILFWMSTFVFLLQDFGLISKSLWEARREFAWFSYAGTIASIFIVPFLPQINNKFFGKGNWLYKKFIEPVLIYWEDSKLMTKIIVFSLLLQISVALCHVYIALSLNINIPLSYFLVFYPLTTIAGFMVPSLNGLGVREGAYIYFLSKVGINSDLGLAFGMGWLIVLLITSIIGGIIYMFGDFRLNKDIRELEIGN